MTNRLPPPILAVMLAVAMWWLDRHHPGARWFTGAFSRAGWVLVALGVAIDMAAFLQFRSARTTINPLRPERATSLVQSGVFRISRNPMYLGLALVLLGWAWGLGSASPWLLPPAFAAVVTIWQIGPEEQALRRIFGDDYVRYQRRVGRWFGWRRLDESMPKSQKDGFLLNRDR